MKKKFNVILLFIILFCSGCNIKYELNISQAVDENIIVDSLNNIDNNDAFLSTVEILFQGTLYDVKQYNDGTIKTKYLWNNINLYKDNSLLFMKILDSDSLSVKGSKVSMNLRYNDSLNELVNLLGNIDSLEVSLYIPYYVSKHNADKVSDNTYTWIIKDINKDSIKVKFDMSKGADFRYKIFAVIAVALIIGAAAWVVMYFVKRNKEANEI